MYLIKDVGFTLNGKLCVCDGIRAKMFKPSNRIFICNPFWGMADVEVEAHADFSQFPATDSEIEGLFTYANFINIKCLGAGYKELSFYVSTYQPEKVQGYIVFVPACWNIETNGQKIAGRTPAEGVFLLQEGQYLLLDGQKIEVTQGQLIS
jgi:hypothetical protein